jgi:hypothetical protein
MTLVGSRYLTANAKAGRGTFMEWIDAYDLPPNEWYN